MQTECRLSAARLQTGCRLVADWVHVGCRLQECRLSRLGAGGDNIRDKPEAPYLALTMKRKRCH